MASRLYQFALAFVAASTCVIAVDSLPLSGSGNNVIYQRFTDHKPITYTYADSEEVKEFVDVFHTRRRPPPFMFLNDEDLTRFVRCDFDPSLPGCEEILTTTTMIPWIELSLLPALGDGSLQQSTISTSPKTLGEQKSFMESLNYEDNNEEDYNEGAEEEDEEPIEAEEQSDNYVTDNDDNVEPDENANKEA